MEEKKNEAPRPFAANIHIEIDGLGQNRSVSVHGVGSIVDFGCERALLRVGRSRILIRGSELSIAVYENKIVEIFGRVGGVEFL